MSTNCKSELLYLTYVSFFENRLSDICEEVFEKWLIFDPIFGSKEIRAEDNQMKIHQGSITTLRRRNSPEKSLGENSVDHIST